MEHLLESQQMQGDPNAHYRLKMTRAASGSLGKADEEVELRRLSSAEEQDMLLAGIEKFTGGAGSNGFAKFFAAKAQGQSNPYGFVDENGIPHSNPIHPEEGQSGFAAFAMQKDADGQDDHTYTEQQKVMQPTTGFGAGEGVDAREDADGKRREPSNDGGMMAVGEADELSGGDDLTPHKPDELNRNPFGKGQSHGAPGGRGAAQVKEEIIKKPLPNAPFGSESEEEQSDLLQGKFKEGRRLRRKAEDFLDSGNFTSEVVDERSHQEQNPGDIPEDLPGKYVPEHGDGSHPLPPESFENWETQPIPGVSQGYPDKSPKDTSIMGSLVKIKVADGRVLIGRVAQEDSMSVHFIGRVAGDRSDSSFTFRRTDVLNKVPFTVKASPAVRAKAPAREVKTLESAYDLYKRTRRAKEDYQYEKRVIEPQDKVDQQAEQVTKTRQHVGKVEPIPKFISLRSPEANELGLRLQAYLDSPAPTAERLARYEAKINELEDQEDRTKLQAFFKNKTSGFKGTLGFQNAGSRRKKASNYSFEYLQDYLNRAKDDFADRGIVPTDDQLIWNVGGLIMHDTHEAPDLNQVAEVLGLGMSSQKITGRKAMKKTADLMQQLEDAGIETDHHESDLYVQDSPEAREILDENGAKYVPFIDNIDHEPWLEIAFGFSPFFANASKKKTAASANIHSVIQGAKDDLKERYDGMNPDEKSEFLEEPNDVIHEVADSNVPVYNSDILELAVSDLNLATDTPELGPAFDGSPTPVNIIAANIYERIQQELFEYVEELKNEEPNDGETVEGSKRMAKDLGMCQECGRNPAIATFVAENGDDVNYCHDCAEYLGAQIKPGFVASKRTAAAPFGLKPYGGKTFTEDDQARTDNGGETFYGDDKALKDQLDSHEKRASKLAAEAQKKLKLAENYEKAGDLEKAKEMDKEAAALYNEWKTLKTTIASIARTAKESRKVMASARGPKLFFDKGVRADPNNPFE